MSMTPTLIHIGYSPWSEKARWALQAQAIDTIRKPYLPMVGEPALRWRLRGSGLPPSVPVLLTEDGPVGDSLAIARWGARHTADGGFLRDLDPEIVTAWTARSEAMLAATRARVTATTLASSAALNEAIPNPLRLGSLGLLMGRLGARFIQRKYELSANPVEAAEAQRAVLRIHGETLREALATRGDYLVGGRFTWLDLAMAVSLQGVRPPEQAHLRLGPATRTAWTDNALVSEFEDLLAWRDRIYNAHR